jgi:hypothetical protein
MDRAMAASGLARDALLDEALRLHASAKAAEAAGVLPRASGKSLPPSGKL